MFLIYFHYIDYLAGDEFISVDSLTNEFLSDGGPLATEHSFIQTYPNPFDQSTTIAYSLKNAATGSLYIYDMQGRVVSKLVDRENQPEGTSQVDWNGTNLQGAEVPSGVYFYSIMIDGVPFSGKVVKK